ncbi:MAG: DNA replication/repair protein RecF [Anaerolineae bacterium]|nr:DNA replication/repair protein RecF [Anaerolineae bacterium]
MYIKSLSLRHFRTYMRLELDLPTGPILLMGANAQGKTSLLEAIAYLALGHSPLTHMDQQLLHWSAVESGMPFAQVRVEVVKRDRVETLEIALQHAHLTNGNTRLDKRIRVDNRAIRRSALSGHLNVVLFLPEDVQLVSGPPSGRRRHLDDLLSQVYPEYVDELSEYQTAISRRNALLRHLRDHGGDRRQLEPLEETLVRTGVTLTLFRRRVLALLSLHADRYHQELTGGAAWLHLEYQPNFDPQAPPQVDYQMGLRLRERPEVMVDVATLQNSYRKTLQQRRERAIQRGATLTGPHRDDVTFMSGGYDLGTYGSRGQQRTAVLALRLAELQWLEQETGESPVLLLDEVLAELDRTRRAYLLNLLGKVQQTILATTDAEMFPAEFREQALKLRVAGGIITPS